MTAAALTEPGFHADHLVAHLTAEGGEFLDENRKRVELKGVNWFGFNDNFRDAADGSRLQAQSHADSHGRLRQCNCAHH